MSREKKSSTLCFFKDNARVKKIDYKNKGWNVKKINSEAVKKAAEIVGGKQKLATIVGVAYKTILDWTSGRSGITVGNALKIERATNSEITAKEILPSFPWDELNK